MQDQGVQKLYYKLLAPNDNSKNQLYFGPDLSSLNIIPTGDMAASETVSTKKAAKGKVKFSGPVNFFWLNEEGVKSEAPKAQLIFYPQYPEVRFSGFLIGCKEAPSELMNPNKRGRDEGRVLFLGVADDNSVLGFIAAPESHLSKEAHSNVPDMIHGLFNEVKLTGVDERATLLNELLRIHNLGWIEGKRLSSPDGTYVTCNNPNCGGYTLEAELGIMPNGISEPDFMGWEVKQYGVSNFGAINSKVITLMTPEPSGGFYKDAGADAFIRKYGYPDKNGVADRWNFGGIHKVGDQHATTILTLSLLGYDQTSKKITESNGGIALVAGDGEIAAIWHFTKMMDHWKKKHTQAVYIPSCSINEETRKYHYGSRVRLGEGTEFLMYLKAMASQSVYYDPGIKMENASTSPKIKKRSQFRIKTGNLQCLYHKMEEIDLHLQ
jgi:hypothetical protein